MGHPHRNMEDSGAETYLSGGGLAQGVSEGRRICARGLETILVIFGKECGCFLACPKSLSEAKLKSFWMNCVGRGDFKTA